MNVPAPGRRLVVWDRAGPSHRTSLSQLSDLKATSKATLPNQLAVENGFGGEEGRILHSSHLKYHFRHVKGVQLHLHPESYYQRLFQQHQDVHHLPWSQEHPWWEQHPPPSHPLLRSWVLPLRLHKDSKAQHHTYTTLSFSHAHAFGAQEDPFTCLKLPRMQAEMSVS